MVKTEMLPSGSCLPRGGRGCLFLLISLFSPEIHALFPPFPLLLSLCFFVHIKGSQGKPWFWLHEQVQAECDWKKWDWEGACFSFMCLGVVQIILNFYYKLLCIIKTNQKKSKRSFIYKEGKTWEGMGSCEQMEWVKFSMTLLSRFSLF